VSSKFADGLSKGDEVAVGAGGEVSAIGARTPKYKFVVKDFTTTAGLEAVKLIAL
jgi:hypothetical protein